MYPLAVRSRSRALKPRALGAGDSHLSDLARHAARIGRTSIAHGPDAQTESAPPLPKRAYVSTGFAGKGRTVDPLVLALFVNVVERPQHLDGGDVRAGVVDDALRAVLDEKFEKRERLDC